MGLGVATLEVDVICSRCGHDGAGLMYQWLYRTLWFHPRCWKIARICDSRFSQSPLSGEAKRAINMESEQADTANVHLSLITTRPEGGDAAMTPTHVITGDSLERR